MDPTTAFLIAALMMLLNGGVLGLMHGDLPAALRPSAISWRIGTLLQACGCILFAVQQFMPAELVLPLGNGLVMLGVAGCWRAMRQFYGLPDRWILLLPALLGTLGIWWFAGPQPDFIARIVIASLAWCVMLVAAAWTVLAATRREQALSARVLAGIFAVLALFMLLRGVYFVVMPGAAGTIVDRSSWINALTPMLAAVLPVIGTTGFLLLCSDRIRRQWERAASTDYLTGLANRRTIAALGAQRLAQAARGSGGFALALVDIDHFKAINDRHGHEAGDLALQQVARLLQAAAGSGDLAGRQGGEEFVVLLAAAGAAQALAAAGRLREAVRAQPLQLGAAPVAITVSIGVAVAQGEHSLDDLLRRADAALYQAKAAGRDRVELG
ncbi:GGDEF domain-containing protein [Tahibacter harae]|uniref:diguanylate cyclase n=1 Tax=Tahibacter harae TaxID=2963937 RepID=A0ABT1QT21_9GAMM|nr:GGDEF domain-containing protein [Tahibacter harae]MCQ4165440.1 GGDEF domain-containing protein [Tahibacter harae]